MHADCLATWIERRRETRTDETAADAYVCEVCHRRYAVAERYTLVCDYRHLCRAAAVLRGCEAASLCVSFILVVLVLVTLPPADEESTGSKVLLGVIFAFSVVVTASAIWHACRRWRRAASDRALVDAPSRRPPPVARPQPTPPPPPV